MLRIIIENHSQPPNGAQALLFTDWFNASTTETAMGCRVTRNTIKICEVKSALTSGPNSIGAVTPAQIAAFDKVAPTLPSSAPDPPLEHLIIVSFWRDGKWTTRIYDRSNLPPQVVKAHQILGITGFDKPAK